VSNRGLYQAGLVFAMLTALAWALFVIGLVSAPSGQDAGPVAGYVADAASTGTILYLWGGVARWLCIVQVYLSICLGFARETGSVLLAPVGLALMGAAFLTLGFMVDTRSAVYTFAPVVAQADQLSAESTLVAAQFAQDSIEMTWSMGSFLAYGGPIVWIAILLFRSNRVPSWSNLAGVVAGLAGFVWILSWLPLPPAGPIPLLVNIVLGMVWFVGLALVLVRTDADHSATVATQSAL